MISDLSRYHHRLIRDGIATTNHCALVGKSLSLEAYGSNMEIVLGKEILALLPHTAIAIAKPDIGFIDLLIHREGEGSGSLAPRDSETRGFLHEIPFMNAVEYRNRSASDIAAMLTKRKGIVIEGIGIIGTGALTVEQAYITISSIYHALFIKYLHDVLSYGLRSDDEAGTIKQVIDHCCRPVNYQNLPLADQVPTSTGEARAVTIQTGKALVEAGLVDSFFGNISCVCDNKLFISQTGASLDELEGQIDPVPFDSSSTAGLTASSELPAHLGIIEQTGASVVLHGHPRFTVAMSLLCDIEGCSETRCWQYCPLKRTIDGIPIVSGETGIGGLETTLPPAMKEAGLAVVYGHGTFAIDSHSGSESGAFKEAFEKIARLENYCREEICQRLLELIRR